WRSSTCGDDYFDLPEAPSRNEPKEKEASHAPPAKLKRADRDAAHKRFSTHGQDDFDLHEAPSRNELKEKEASCAPPAKPKRTNRDVAHKKSSTRGQDDFDLHTAPSESRNEPKEKVAPRAPPAKPKRADRDAAHKKSSTHGQESRSYASPTPIDKDNGSDYDNQDNVNSRDVQWDSDVGDAIQVDDNTAHDSAATQDSLAESPLSQLSDVDDETVSTQGSRMGSTIPTKRIKFTFSAAMKDNDDTAPPRKKAKKAPQTMPSKRNPARAKRANGI
ncbi:hypothetical protein OG21DRAFT_1317401, partial [Imleria badia]